MGSARQCCRLPTATGRSRSHLSGSCMLEVAPAMPARRLDSAAAAASAAAFCDWELFATTATAPLHMKHWPIQERFGAATV